MSIPKEPRQIMINLMYLVLTALLALNISKEILNAFTTLSSSIDKSNKSIDQRTNEVYAQIVESEKQKGQEEKVKPYRLKADEVVKRSDEMIAYLNDWKKIFFHGKWRESLCRRAKGFRCSRCGE